MRRQIHVLRPRKRSTSRRPNALRKRQAQIESLETRTLLAGDLVAHWSADSLNGEVADGAPIANWADSIGNVDAVGDGSPLLVKSQLSGHSVVRFDPADGRDIFRVGTGESPVDDAADFTVAVVFTTSGDTVGANGNWYDNTGLVDATRLGFTADWGISLSQSGQIGTGLGKTFGVPPHSVYSTETGLNDGSMHLAVVARTGGNLAIYVDDGTPTKMNGADDGPRAQIGVTFGSLNSDKNPYSGDIAEIRFYDGALDDAEVGQLYQQIDSVYNNSAPTAVDDSYDLVEDPASVFHQVSTLNGLLKNDSDLESDSLSAVLVANASHGNIALNANGSFIYAPDPDFFGTDSFTYTANDSQASNVATVTLNVANVYDAASAVADTYKAVPSEVLSVGSDTGVLGNDENPDRVALKAVLSRDVTNGTLALSEDGSFQYDPQGFAGTTDFAYKVDDGNQLSDEVSVMLVVNTPPTANDDSFDVAEDTELVRNAADGVAGNDVDADGNAVTVSLVDGTLNGSLTLNDDGSFAYLPDADYFGSDQFTYRLHDGEDESEVGTVGLSITAVDDSPVASNDGYFSKIDEVISVGADRHLLLNDVDIDSNQLTAELATGPANGSVQLQADGTFTYTPNPGFEGTDTFGYRANDGNSLSAEAEVTLFVGAPPVQISEIMTANVASLNTRVRETVDDSFRGEQLSPDWLELQNLSSSLLDISGFHVTDNDNDLTRWAFPEGTTIAPNGFLLVAADRLNITDPSLDELGLLHTNFKLTPSGEFVGLTSPDGTLLQEFSPSLPDQRADVSYGIGENGEIGYLLTNTPDAPNGGIYPGVVDDTTFSIDRGLYTEAFQVEITTLSEGAQIRYTTDGTNPSATHGEVYSGPITISTTTVLKAVALIDNYLPSNVDAQSYIFPADVMQQTGEGLEGARWGHAGPDWEMDPIVVNHEDPEIRPEVEDLARIPTVSLSLDFEEMFGRRGIYIAGENIEKPVSFEFFDPARGDNGVQANSTIQIVGGSSPNRWKSDKLSMRVRFTEDEGVSDLDYPVFGAGATTSFDTLVVDARLNNVWHYGGGSSPAFQREIAQYMRDEFAADLQNEVGGYAPHGQHAHVYINGIYWGMHILHERPDENFMASYNGGFGEDYDVVKHNANTVVNGSNETFREMFQILGSRGDVTDEQWDQIQTMLHVEGLIDYMLVNMYGGNQDWDHHNWYASRHVEEGLWRFHSWDAEKVLQGIRDNVTGENNANSPSRLHQRLRTHPEYLLKFKDQVQKHLFNGGAMTPEAATKLYRGRSDQIDPVMRIESARWGDNQIDNGDRKRYVRPDWVEDRDWLVESYFPQRTDEVIRQFVRRDWFVVGEAPEFSINGNAQHGGFIDAGSSLSMSAADGEIFFTVDGSDPRVAGGELGASAQLYSEAVTVDNSMIVKARLRMADGSWGALSEARFVTSVAATTENLRISELHYHPGDPSQQEIDAGFDNSDDFEFIEIVNISNQPVDLSNVAFQQVAVGNDIEGVDFRFADGDILEIGAGQRVVVVEDVAAFELRYGPNLPVAGQWSGRLGNRAERVVLVSGDQTLHDFTYTEEWYPTTDGDGPSLQVVNETAEDLGLWGRREGWSVGNVGGSPGTEAGEVLVGDSNRDGVFDSGDLVTVFVAGEYEDDIPDNSTFEEGDWNGDGDFDSGDLVEAFRLGHYVAGAVPQATRLAIATNRGDVAANLLGQIELAPDLEPADELVARIEARDRLLPGADLQLAQRDELFDELAKDAAERDDRASSLSDELLDELTSTL